MNWNRMHTAVNMAVLRTLLLGVNTVLLISGVLLFLLGLILRSQTVNLHEIIPEMHSSAPYAVLGFGLSIFLVGLFAFWCTMRKNIASLHIYSCVLLLIFLSEILLAVTVLTKKRTYETTLKNSLRRVMNQYPHEPLNIHIDHLQASLSCCGIDSYVDWFESSYGKESSRVPAACCKTPLNHTCTRINLDHVLSPLDIHTNGCYTTVIGMIKQHYPLLGGLLLVIALIPLLGVIFACALVHQMGKHRYEKVN